MTNKVIIINNISCFSYQFILNIYIKDNITTELFSNKLIKEQYIQENIHIYYQYNKIKNDLLFHKCIFDKSTYFLSQSLIYSLFSIEDIALVNILSNIYYKKYIPVFPITMYEKLIF